MAEKTERTVGDVLEELTDEQQKVEFYAIQQAVEQALAKQEAEHAAQYDDEEDLMHSNVFQDGRDEFLAHATDFFEHSDEVFNDGKRYGSLKESVIEHAATYGIDNVDYLFPDPKDVYDTPEFKKRQTEWVDVFMNGTHKTPFSRIKSIAATSGSMMIIGSVIPARRSSTPSSATATAR